MITKTAAPKTPRLGACGYAPPRMLAARPATVAPRKVLAVATQRGAGRGVAGSGTDTSHQLGMRPDHLSASTAAGVDIRTVAGRLGHAGGGSTTVAVVTLVCVTPAWSFPDRGAGLGVWFTHATTINKITRHQNSNPSTRRINADTDMVRYMMGTTLVRRCPDHITVSCPEALA